MAALSPAPVPLETPRREQIKRAFEKYRELHSRHRSYYCYLDVEIREGEAVQWQLPRNPGAVGRLPAWPILPGSPPPFRRGRRARRGGGEPEPAGCRPHPCRA